MIGTATAGSEFKPRHVYLVDGSGYIFRAFHALPPMTRPDGTPVNAVYGFTNMLLKLISESDADYIAVIFDAARATFRNEIYPEYKAHRPPPPEELIPQFALIREAARAFNVPAIELAGFEADDLIATYARLAREAGAKVTIVSSDKDLMQLVGGTASRCSIRSRTGRIGEAEVMEKFGVGPGEGGRRPGAGRRFDRQRAGRAGHRRQDRGRADQRIRRSRDAAGARRRDQAAQAPRGPASQCRAGAHLSRELVALEDDVPVPVPLDALHSARARSGDAAAFLEAQTSSARSSRAWRARRVPSPRPRRRGRWRGRPRARPRLSARRARTSPRHPSAQNYELVQSEEALAPWIARALAAGIVAFDTETTSLDATQARLVGVSLSLEPGEARGACEACYVPLGHKAPQHQGTLDLGENAAREAPKQMALKRALGC